MSLDNFYKLRNDFLIVGLTGRMGGGWAETKLRVGWVKMCLRQAQAPKTTHWLSGAEITGSMSENVPSTGSGTESNTVIELVEITGSMSENVPSTGSGTESNTVIERSRNHQRNNIKRWLSGVEATTMKNLSYKYLKICYFFRKFRYSIK